MSFLTRLVPVGPLVHVMRVNSGSGVPLGLLARVTVSVVVPVAVRRVVPGEGTGRSRIVVIRPGSIAEETVEIKTWHSTR